ncbi:alpha/beta hydrolase [Chryseobacterium wangxinyae]|uniref:alpha/beta hydrolase n=1 Tax=Chryseobacterium sp. CY353 TaxID=2997334 RepID=UPI002271ACCF|nr:alpha/beta hydrolase [Chryseobacterium sp. CY353]MCY0969391.1 alpha/beta hydrolase [Chryseobacterium sp. CY353]
MSAQNYTTEKVTFKSHETNIRGLLFIPEGKKMPMAAFTVLGPVAFVKEQSPIQYATRLAKEGFVVLIYDPRFHGESDGEPRRFESGQAKVEDIIASVNYLESRKEVDKNKIQMLGICQGANWAIKATNFDTRIKNLFIVAGHYLTRETADMYNGGAVQTDLRIKNAKIAKEKFEKTGDADYIKIVKEKEGDTALLTAKPVAEWYLPWENHQPYFAFRGLWENRITQMSELELWTTNIAEDMKKLETPTLVIHSYHAATGVEIPKKLFALIPSKHKKLVWLGSQIQFQFYEESVTIDQCVKEIISFLK